MSATAFEIRQAAALLVNRDGEYLLHLRDAHKPIGDPGTWSLPGGAREGDETLHEAVDVQSGGDRPGTRRPQPVRRRRVRRPRRGHEGAHPGLPWPLGRRRRDAAHHRGHHVPPLRRRDDRPADDESMGGQGHCPAPGRHRRAPAAGPARGRRPDPPNVIGVHLYLEDPEGRVLLGLRHPDSAYAASTHHFLAGHCEQESAVACLIREAREEAGRQIKPDDVELHTPCT